MKYYIHKQSDLKGMIIRKVDSEGIIYSYDDGEWIEWINRKDWGGITLDSFYNIYREMSKAEVVKWMLKR
jgi:hypothetical protein